MFGPLRPGHADHADRATVHGVAVLRVERGLQRHRLLRRHHAGLAVGGGRFRRADAVPDTLRQRSGDPGPVALAQAVAFAEPVSLSVPLPESQPVAQPLPIALAIPSPSPTPPPQRQLTVGRSGAGDGAVTSSPGGISCPSDWSQGFDEGTRVTLSADPDSRSTFGGWSGDCGGTGTCTVTMNGARSVTARFDLPSQYTLSVTTTGGTVVSSPFGIDCGSGGNDCSQIFDRGSTVGLTALPDLGSLFDHWTGACSGGSLGCSVTMMSQPQSVGAVFRGLSDGDPGRAARPLR
jgi:List-Bact-rpt repeat protein